MNDFKILDKRTRIILIIQAFCMLAGASTHIKWILENGIFVQQGNAPFFSTIFWDSLTFFDVIAAVLLVTKPKAGILLTLVIITTDVIHNNFVLVFLHQHINELGVGLWATKYWMLIGQLLFMVFVFATLKNNLAEIHRKSRRGVN